MNALFMTQSSSLPLFYDLMKAMRKPMAWQKIGFYVTDSLYYEKFLRDHPDFEQEGYMVVKEWELMEKARREPLNMERLRQYEKELGVPSLWPAVVSDRRIYMGKTATLHQDYAPRFDQEEMMRILQQTLGGIERLFDQVQPDVVFSFVCVTMGEFLAYLFAEARRVRTMNLRPTRIKNCMTWGPSIFEPSADIQKQFERYYQQQTEDHWMQEAKDYLEQSQKKHALYEGVILPGQKANVQPLRRGNLFSRLWTLLRNESRYLTSIHRHDHHNPGLLTTLFYKRFFNPWTARKINAALKPVYAQKDDLLKMKYAFFPLHTEPEVTLLVYSRQHMNQIEGIRAFSQSLPVGTNLVVKEHPASIGKRPLSYYRKILQIPNVVLADPHLSSRDLIEHADLITIIVGSVGFEALMLKKPVVALGRSPFEILPDTMMRRVPNPENLDAEIKNLLETYQFDERAMVAYIAATMRLSAHVDFYSVLLGKFGVFRVSSTPNGNAQNEYQNQVEKFAAHTIERLHQNQTGALENAARLN